MGRDVKLLSICTGFVRKVQGRSMQRLQIRFLFASFSGWRMDIQPYIFVVALCFLAGKYLKDMAGSPFYLAPEVLAEKYGPQADVWSAGVVLYILLSGIPPFWANTNEGIFKSIKEAKLNLTRNPWPTISEEGKDLVRKMLTKDPKKRITPHEILGKAVDQPSSSFIRCGRKCGVVSHVLMPKLFDNQFDRLLCIFGALFFFFFFFL